MFGREKLHQAGPFTLAGGASPAPPVARAGQTAAAKLCSGALGRLDTTSVGAFPQLRRPPPAPMQLKWGQTPREQYRRNTRGAPFLAQAKLGAQLGPPPTVGRVWRAARSPQPASQD